MNLKPADLKQIFDAFSAKTGADLRELPLQDFFVIHGKGEIVGEDNATVGALLEHLWAKIGANGALHTKSPVAVIDCDATPSIPVGLKIKEHLKGGQIEFNPAHVTLYLDQFQLKGSIKGADLQVRLASKPVLNACVLDHLLANPHLIPEDWKQDEQGRTRYIHFWGTIYRASSGDQCVQFLFWADGHWHSNYRWIDSYWGDQNPAALLAS